MAADTKHYFGPVPKHGSQRHRTGSPSFRTFPVPFTCLPLTFALCCFAFNLPQNETAVALDKSLQADADAVVEAMAAFLNASGVPDSSACVTEHLVRELFGFVFQRSQKELLQLTTDIICAPGGEHTRSVGQDCTFKAASGIHVPIVDGDTHTTVGKVRVNVASLARWVADVR